MTPDDFDPFAAMDRCCGRLIITPDDMRRGVGDKSKEGYERATGALAGLQYRIAEPAGAGIISHDIAMDLQHRADDVWEWLYYGTLSAVRDYTLDDEHWDDDDEHYSDGRPVRIRTRFQPVDADHAGDDNRRTLRTGAVCEFPRGEVFVIQPRPGKPTPHSMGADEP